MPVTDASLLGCHPRVTERMQLLRSWARFQSTRKPQPLRLEPRTAKVPPNGSGIGTNGQAKMFETMAQRRLDGPIASSVSGRASVRVAIEDLADEVARLSRKLNGIASTANKRGGLAVEKGNFEAAPRGAVAATACEVLPRATEEAPLSPQRNSETSEVIAGELVEETKANFKNSPPEPMQTGRWEENAIAGRVADLYERLGGFIKPSLPKLTDHNSDASGSPNVRSWHKADIRKCTAHVRFRG
jgi:hypothetical protein